MQCLKNIHSQLKEATILQLHPNLTVVVFCPTGKVVPDISKECNGFKISGTTTKWQWHVSVDKTENPESCTNPNLLSLLLQLLSSCNRTFLNRKQQNNQQTKDTHNSTHWLNYTTFHTLRWWVWHHVVSEYFLVFYMNVLPPYRGTQWHSWLRYRATSWKVRGFDSWWCHWNISST